MHQCLICFGEHDLLDCPRKEELPQRVRDAYQRLMNRGENGYACVVILDHYTQEVIKNGVIHHDSGKS